MSATSPSPTQAPRALRHRRSARRLSGGQLDDLCRAVIAAQKIGDDRGYQYWAGIHGLPLPEWCQHSSRRRDLALVGLDSVP
jgi:tyrosinase